MANRSVFAASANNTTNGVALVLPTEEDILVKKIVVGTPVSAGNIWLYSITNPVNAATTNIALKITFPTFSTTNINPGVYVIDLAGNDPSGGLRLTQGGNLTIDQTMNVTVIFSEDVR